MGFVLWIEVFRAALDHGLAPCAGDDGTGGIQRITIGPDDERITAGSELSGETAEDVRLIDYDFARWGSAAERTRLLERWSREVRASAR